MSSVYQISKKLAETWNEMDKLPSHSGQMCLRLAFKELLYRTYIGISGDPCHRIVIFEIPKIFEKQLAKASVPNGMDLLVVNTGNEKNGFVSLLMRAISVDHNDIFTELLQDIIFNLQDKKTEEAYMLSLQDRIDTWMRFFKDKPREKLSAESERGLFGELTVLEALLKEGVDDAVCKWCGPIKAAQDFVCESTAVEVKTITEGKKQVKISSVEQLDTTLKESLFLSVVEISVSDDGITLPDFIEEIFQKIPFYTREMFVAKLTCVGYDHSLKDLYTNKYQVQKIRHFKVVDTFPRLRIENFPEGIIKAKYELLLSACEPFETVFSEMINTLKECNNGEE